MIEFQLTIYMCSHCTRVHNAAHECLQHELKEHSAKDTVVVPDSESTRKIDDSAEQSTTHTSTDNDVKPDMDDSEIQRCTSSRAGDNQIITSSKMTTAESSVPDSVIGFSDLHCPSSTSHSVTDRQPTAVDVKKDSKSTTTHNSAENAVTIKKSSQCKIPCQNCGKVGYFNFVLRSCTNFVPLHA